eukprot:757586-Hanusia_phi.AAC.2
MPLVSVLPRIFNTRKLVEVGNLMRHQGRTSALPSICSHILSDLLSSGPITSLKFFGSFNLVSASDDGTMLIWRCKANTLLTGGEDKIVRVWDVRSGKSVQQFPQMSSSVITACSDGDIQMNSWSNSDKVLWKVTQLVRTSPYTLTLIFRKVHVQESHVLAQQLSKAQKKRHTKLKAVEIYMVHDKSCRNKMSRKKPIKGVRSGEQISHCASYCVNFRPDLNLPDFARPSSSSLALFKRRPLYSNIHLQWLTEGGAVDFPQSHGALTSCCMLWNERPVGVTAEVMAGVMYSFWVDWPETFFPNIADGDVVRSPSIDKLYSKQIFGMSYYQYRQEKPSHKIFGTEMHFTTIEASILHAHDRR